MSNSNSLGQNTSSSKNNASTRMQFNPKAIYFMLKIESYFWTQSVKHVLYQVLHDSGMTPVAYMMYCISLWFFLCEVAALLHAALLLHTIRILLQTGVQNESSSPAYACAHPLNQLTTRIVLVAVHCVKYYYHHHHQQQHHYSFIEVFAVRGRVHCTTTANKHLNF